MAAARPHRSLLLALSLCAACGPSLGKRSLPEAMEQWEAAAQHDPSTGGVRKQVLSQEGDREERDREEARLLSRNRMSNFGKEFNSRMQERLAQQEQEQQQQEAARRKQLQLQQLQQQQAAREVQLHKRKMHDMIELTQRNRHIALARLRHRNELAIETNNRTLALAVNATLTNLKVQFAQTNPLLAGEAAEILRNSATEYVAA